MNKHIIEANDSRHKLFYRQQKKIAIKSLKKGMSQYDIENKGEFIFGSKILWKIWKENFSEEEIKKIRKKNKYKKKIFICKKCKRKYKKRQSMGLCDKCMSFLNKYKKRKNKKFNCIICNKKIFKSKLRVCFHCLYHTQKGKSIFCKNMKGINKGNPGWARVKKSNNYIEQRTVNELSKFYPNIKSQKQIGNYRVDILLHDNIIVECDGSQHWKIKEQFKRDKIRDIKLTHIGYRIIRFNACCIKNYLNRLVYELKKFIHQKRKVKRKMFYLDKYGKKMQM
jgi:very-short-patch-repair endonuclease